MDKKINILIFPCGAENALEIHLALKDVVNINLIGASSKEDHGSYVFKNYIGNLPNINNHEFISSLNRIVEEQKIDVIIPTHDDVVLKLAQEINNIKTKIAVPGLKQAEICRSKKRTYEIFKEFEFCPIVYNCLSELTEFPIFAKPDCGQGGKGAFIISSDNHKNYHSGNFKEYVFCEFLPGEEMTVDCFTDFNGVLKFIGPRVRERVSNGISVRSYTVKLTKEIEEIAQSISKKIGMNGLWYFQLKKDVKDKYKLLEVSTRASGTMSLYRGLGVNFPLLTVYNLMGYPTSVICNDYNLEVDRALFNRYKHDFNYETIYIDFDDTITKNGEVNAEVMMFIYNAKVNHKKIILITKHEHKLAETLDRLFIHKGLFDDIIQIQKSDFKYQYIKNSDKCIFIDNAFQERYEVKKHLNIPVFDVDAIQTLINWKN